MTITVTDPVAAEAGVYLRARSELVLGTVNASALGSYSLTLNSSGVALVQSWINTPSANQEIIITSTTSVDELVFSARNASTKANAPSSR